MISDKNESAFTLIELLVVIAIIALLMGILMPILGRVRKQGRAVACLGHLNQWGLVFSIYANENDGRFPDGLSQTSGKGYYTWMDRMSSYYKSEEGYQYGVPGLVRQKARVERAVDLEMASRL